MEFTQVRRETNRNSELDSADHASCLAIEGSSSEDEDINVGFDPSDGGSGTDILLQGSPNKGFNTWESCGDSAQNMSKPDTTILSNFKAYVGYANRNYMMGFGYNMQNAIALMRLLRQTKASLGTYESVMKWHFVASRKLKEHEKLGKHKLPAQNSPDGGRIDRRRGQSWAKKTATAAH